MVQQFYVNAFYRLSQYINKIIIRAKHYLLLPQNNMAFPVVYLESSMQAVVRSVIFGYRTFRLSNSSCAHRMNLRR